MVCESNIRRPKWFPAFLVASCFLLPCSASTLTFHEAQSGQFTYLQLDGDIVRGDADRLEYLLFSGKIDSRLVAFNSDGGNLWEGVLLGRLLRHHGFSTYVRPKEKCLSACLFAFMGGEQRYVYPGGSLGGHQFYGGSERVQTQAVTQYSTADLFKFAREMGVASQAIEIAASTPPSEMHIYTEDEMRGFALSIPHKPEAFSTREAKALGIGDKTYQARWNGFLGQFNELCPMPAAGFERTMCAYSVMRLNGIKR